MDKSVFGSAIKTYPSKTKRISRAYSYRPSALTQSLFGNTESEELFDKLVEEEKVKQTLIKGSFGDIIKEKHKSYGSNSSTTLKNIQNVNCEDSRRIHQISTQSHKQKNVKYSCFDKENVLKLSSRLFLNDSDNSNDNLLNLSAYQFSLDELNSNPKCKYSKLKLQKPKTISKSKFKKVNRKPKILAKCQRTFSNSNSKEAAYTHKRLSPTNSSVIPKTFSTDDTTTPSLSEKSSFNPRMKERDRIFYAIFGNSYSDISKINKINSSESQANSADRSSVFQSFEKNSQSRNSNTLDFIFENTSFQFQPKGMSTPEFRQRITTVPKCGPETVVCEETNLEFGNPNHDLKMYTDIKSSKSSVYEDANAEKEPVQDTFSKPDESDNAVEKYILPKTDVSCERPDTNVEQCNRSVCTWVESTFHNTSTENRILEEKSVNCVSDSVDSICQEISQLTFQNADEYSVTQKTNKQFSLTTVLDSESTNEEILVSSLKDFHLTTQNDCKSEDMLASVCSCPSIYIDSLLDTVVAKNASYCGAVSECSMFIPSRSSRSNNLCSRYVLVEPSPSRKSTNNADASKSCSEFFDSEEFTVINGERETLSPNLIENESNSVLEEILINETPKFYEDYGTEVEASITSIPESNIYVSVMDLQQSEEGDNSIITNVCAESSLDSELSLSSVLTDTIIKNEMDSSFQNISKINSGNISMEVNVSDSTNFYGFENEIVVKSNKKLHVIRDIVEKLNEKRAVNYLSSTSILDEDCLSHTAISESAADESDNEIYVVRTSSPEKEIIEKGIKKSEIMKVNYFERYHKNPSNIYPKFETVLEENGEEVDEDEKPLTDIKNCGCAFLPRNCGNFTERKKKPCPLPPLMEEEAENAVSYSRDSRFDQSSVRVNEGSTMSQSLYLSKGKKWRHSFIVLKNIRSFGLNRESLEDENKGRLYKQNIENLICNQQNVSVLKETDECSFLRTEFNNQFASGFDEGDISDTGSHSERARFSLCISANPVSGHDITQNFYVHERTLTWFMQESSQSVIYNFDIPAGDTSTDQSIPFIDYGIPHSAREITLHYCKQSEPLPFEKCFPESVLQNCEKIGEGVYGEVFMLKRKSQQKSVLKIIPIEGDQLVNGERQKKFDEILSELVITFELSNLRNRSDYYTNCFAEIKRCHCVYGKYPPRLLTLWEEYDIKKGSVNDSPKIFKSDQLYIILELNNGGKDLESCEFSNALQALSVFNQVAYALAVAEQAFMFEHRDLHWGNILVSSTQREDTTFILNKRKRNVKLHGVEVTIIDYTLSRISINNRILYNNIGQDPELFTAEGDFQFEIYRLMKEEVKNTWDQFAPRTNILWLYYLLDKLIKEVRYRMKNTRNNIKIHNQNLKKLKELYEVVMKAASSYDLIGGR